jgi:hypothetical protein
MLHWVVPPETRRRLRPVVSRARALGRRLSAGPVTARVVYLSWDSVEVRARRRGRPTRLSFADPAASVAVSCDRLLLVVPDVAALVRLATAGIVRGRTASVEVRLDRFGPEHRAGLALPRLSKHTMSVSWTRAGAAGARLAVRWAKPRPVARCLQDLCSGAVRGSTWDQAGGPLFALDRAADLDARAPWPAGRLGADPAPAVPSDADPAPLCSPQAFGLAAHHSQPVMTSVANPFGRVLAGLPATYRADITASRVRFCDDAGRAVLELTDDRPAESGLLAAGPAGAAGLAGGWQKYCVVDLDLVQAPPSPFAMHALRALACCGTMFRSADERVRAALAALNVLVVEPGARAELDWCRLSVAASRQATIHHDPVLRHTALVPADEGTGERRWLPLPAVSVLLASRRRDDLVALLPRFAAQTYPAFELLVGTHGYRLGDDLKARLAESSHAPIRWVESDPQESLGQLLGRLSRIADGELLSKVDDDDHYGREHLTDLVLGWRTSGADLVGKGARFMHLPERDLTVDRRWSAAEVDDVTVAGGTMLVSRCALLAAGGWSEAPRHVDTHMVERLRGAGGVTHRIHGLDYVYVRRGAGHTWAADLGQLVAQGAASYAGLPAAVIN